MVGGDTHSGGLGQVKGTPRMGFALAGRAGSCEIIEFIVRDDGSVNGKKRYNSMDSELCQFQLRRPNGIRRFGAALVKSWMQ